MAIRMLPYAASLAPIFDHLNRAWIEEFFTIEPLDELMLTKPQQTIIDKGGEIWFAALDDKVVGACALLSMSTGIYEFSKLGVDASARGKGVARALLHHCRERAIAMGGHTLRILTNRSLVAANTLYQSEGFIEIEMTPAQQQRYTRADIMYNLALAAQPSALRA